MVYASIPNHMAMNYEYERHIKAAQDAENAEAESFFRAQQTIFNSFRDAGKIEELLLEVRPLEIPVVTIEEHKLHPSIEGRVSRISLPMGGESGRTLLKQISPKVQYIGSIARDVVESQSFIPLPERTNVDLVKGRIRDFTGNSSIVTTAWLIGREDDVDDKRNKAPFTKGLMTKLGLHFSPSETVLAYLIENGDGLSSVGDYLRPVIRPLPGRHGLSKMLSAGRNDDGLLWLDGVLSEPDDEWRPDVRVVFALSQVTSNS